MKPVALFLLAAAAVRAEEAAAPAVSGTTDIGYRWVSDVGGNFNAYRSIVNLGSGPKLFGVDYTIQDPSKRLFDRVNVRGEGWGGDPYKTARLAASKDGIYRFSFDYRNIAYFNFLPSYALNQRASDTARRLSDFELELRPGKRIVPYLAYSRDAGSGRGITNFYSDANEYPVATLLNDKTDHFRGGVRMEFHRYHLTLEQGGTTFKDDQRVFTSDLNRGNRTVPLLGETLLLRNLEQAYGVRGDSVYTKAIFTAAPVTWANFYGQFLFSRPRTETNYTQSASGRFVLLQSLSFLNDQRDLVVTQAKQPHTSGSFGVDLRPTRRLRILESITTDHLHSNLSFNYSQQQIEALYDLTSRLTIRGGHRYLWGDARVRTPLLNPVQGLESGELKRNTGLAGATVRFHSRLNANVDFEGASGDRTWFRTSLNDYRKLRARARYQAAGSLQFAAQFFVLDNQNPTPGVQYDFLSRQNSISAAWTPDGGKRISVLAEYMRSSLRSNLSYFVPQELSLQRSIYWDNAHTVTGTVQTTVPGRVQGKFEVGGAFFTAAGSRSTSYYQPLTRFSVPLNKRVIWNAEWRWSGFTEGLYRYEGFRAHQFVAGLRIAR